MRNLTKLTAIFLISALALSSCKKDLKDLIENDLMFNMDANSFLQNQVQLQFVNANSTNTIVSNPKLSIGGKDANLVFDINGGKDIKMDGRFARMVVSPGTPLSPEIPAVFKVKAEAPGYLTYERELTITQLDSFMTYNLEMVELNNAPQGILYNTLEGGVGANGAKIGKFVNNGFSAVAELPAQTQIRDELGTFQKINRLELVQFDGNKDAIAAQIPYLISNFNDKVIYKGNLENFSFYPQGYVQMTVNGKQGKVKFDQPVTVSMSMPQGSIDKVTGDVLNAGDPMQIYQWDELAANWNFVSDAILQMNTGGNLVANVTVNNTGVIAILSNPVLVVNPIGTRTCPSFLGLQFLRNSNVNTKHFVMVVDALDVTKVFDYADVIVANNTTFNFTRRLPINKNYIVIVYEFETFSGKGREITRSNPFSSCAFTTARRLRLNVNPPAVTNRKIARFELDTYCPTSRLFYYHEGRIEYRLSGSIGPFTDLGLARRSGTTVTEILRFRGPTPPPNSPPSATPSFSFLETDRLENGLTYEFKVTITGRPRIGNVNITRTFSKTRKFNETEFEALTGRTPATYQYLKFLRSYWLANADDNQNPCAIWGY